MLDTCPPSQENLPHIILVVVLFGCVNVILLALLSYGRATKFVLIAILLVSACTAYFMDAYQVDIDDEMIDKLLKTDMAESLDLLSLKLLLFLGVVGMVPAFLIYRVAIKRQSFRRALISREVVLGGALTLAAGSVFLFGDFYASFAREYKSLRLYANPSWCCTSSRRRCSMSSTMASRWARTTCFCTVCTDVLAPDEQKRVPMIFWCSESFLEDGVGVDQLRPQLNASYSHDNVFHTVLGLFEVETNAYVPQQDLLKQPQGE